MGINSEKHSPISRRKSIRKRNLSEAGRLSTSRLHFLQSNLVTRYLHTDLHDADERKIPDRILFLSLSAPASYKKHILLLIPLIFFSSQRFPLFSRHVLWHQQEAENPQNLLPFFSLILIPQTRVENVLIIIYPFFLIQRSDNQPANKTPTFDRSTEF